MQSTSKISQAVRVCDVVYVTDSLVSRPEDVIPLGRIAQMKIGDHVGLATAIRAGLRDHELDRVGAMARKAITEPAKMLQKIFAAVAASESEFRDLPSKFSGALRFSNMENRRMWVEVELPDLPQAELNNAIKNNISHQLAGEVRDMIASGPDATTGARDASALPALAALSTAAKKTLGKTSRGKAIDGTNRAVRISEAIYPVRQVG